MKEIKPDKVFLVLCAVAVVATWLCFILDKWMPGRGLRAVGLVLVAITFAAALIPLIGFLLHSALEKTKDRWQRRH